MLDEKLKSIIEYYGVRPQLKHFMGEVYEFIEATLDYENTDTINKDHIKEELADLYVMIGEFTVHYGVSMDEIGEIIDFKVDRTLNRIEAEKQRELAEIEKAHIESLCQPVKENFKDYYETE